MQDGSFLPKDRLHKTSYTLDPAALDDPFVNFELTSNIEFSTGGWLEALSAKNYLADENYPGNDLILPEGYGAIPRLLATGLDVRLNQVVTHIDHNNTQVTVKAGGSSFSADYALVTLPLGCSEQPAPESGSGHAVVRLWDSGFKPSQLHCFS